MAVGAAEEAVGGDSGRGRGSGSGSGSGRGNERQPAHGHPTNGQQDAMRCDALRCDATRLEAMRLNVFLGWLARCCCGGWCGRIDGRGALGARVSPVSLAISRSALFASAARMPQQGPRNPHLSTPAHTCPHLLGLLAAAALPRDTPAAYCRLSHHSIRRAAGGRRDRLSAALFA